MKIGIISNLYPPYVRGGAEQVVVRTVEALTEAGHDVFVITTRPSKKKGVIRDKVSTERVYRFFPWNVYYTLKDYKFPWLIRLVWHMIDAFGQSGARHVSRILMQEKPDVVITHNLKGIGLTIPRAIQASGIPHVHVVHDLQLVVPSGLLFFGKEKRPRLFETPYKIYRAICRRNFARPDLVIYPSKYLSDTYHRYGFFRNAKTIVMPNPAPTFPEVARHDTDENILKLLFVGQLGSHKGVRFLMEAFDTIPGEKRLIIAGEGKRANDVKQKANHDKRIVYLGYISVDQLLNCFGIADAVVVPSLCYENSPTVIYEALQAGVPVLASDIGGVGELVENGVNGYLFTPGSAKAFLQAVEKLKTCKSEKCMTPEQIKKTVAAYAMPNYTRELVRLLDETIKSR